MGDVEIWTLGWLVGGLVVVVAAALLLWILLVGWSLERHTARALRALEAIDRNTKPIWQLSSTTEGLEQVRRDAESVGTALSQLEADLHAKEGART